MSRPNAQHDQPPPVAPKTRKESKHWSQRIQETVVSAVPEEGLGVTITGGADNGQFCCISDISHDQLTYHSGRLHVDEILLEIQGQKIAGYTLRDATIWLKQVSQNGAPVMIKTVKIGMLPRDLRQFLTTRFQKGSVDHDLQQTIRDNLYLRTVPCTTRPPKPGEVNGVDYTFLSLDEFHELERNGCLLESGIYYGNNYGTPKPPKDPTGPIRRSGSIGNAGLGQFPSDGKRKRNRSNTDNGSSKSSPVPFSEEPPGPTHRKKSLEKAHSSGDLGPLPPNWEMAYTEEGHPYFIDHETENTHWLDPRLAHLQKQSAKECSDNVIPTIRVIELPFGWEKVEDPHFGTYFIDHVNRRTQYENPVSAAKKQQQQQGNDVNSTLPRTKKSQDQAKRSASDTNMSSRGAPPEYNSHHPGAGRRRRERRFTKNPAELKGEMKKTVLVKSIRGLGFTIIGGDRADEEFLQIKKVVENGPAHQDGVLKTGDVLVFVDGNNVLGYTHQDIVNQFQTIPPHQKVDLEVCRGYGLPFDPEDPNTEIIVTVAVTLPGGDTPTSAAPPSYSSANDFDYLNTSAKSLKSLPDLTRSTNNNSSDGLSHGNSGNVNSDITPDVLTLFNSKPVILSMNIVRGEMGFGFTIADSHFGQKVKQILDKPRCKTLQEGDILQEINGINVKDMSHSEIVGVLKDCPQGQETKIIVQRGGLPLKSKKPIKPAHSPDDGSALNNSQPGAYFFENGGDSNMLGKQHRGLSSSDDFHVEKENRDEVDSSSRPKTPTHYDGRPKTPSMNDNRPKTPTRTMGPNIDNRNKSSMDNRHPLSEMQNRVQANDDNSRDFGSQGVELNQSRSSSEFYSNSGSYDSRPPPGPRYDHQRPHSRQEGSRPNHTMHNSNYNHQDRDRNDNRFDRGDHAKPGMLRSRTPGPEMFNSRQGSDYRGDANRPKTPTAQDMRSKTPLPGMTYGGNLDFLMHGSRNHNSMGMNGTSRHSGYSGYQRPQWGHHNSMDYPGSPPVQRRGEGLHDNFDNRPFGNGMNNFSGGMGAGRPPRQSTSFEEVEPSPSNLMRVPRKFLHSSSSFNSQASLNQSPRIPPRFPSDDGGYLVSTVTLQRQETGFGFRIIGGTEEGSQVSVGHIVPGGAADVDGRLRTGDEITHVDNFCVVNCSHHQVVQLMSRAGSGGRVSLSIRRPMNPHSGDHHGNAADTYPYEVTVTRRPTEGFGFVIISSVTKSGSTIGEFIETGVVKDWLDRKNQYPWIGRILENSPAERCGQLHVGDRILAVNNVDISHMHHEDIVNIIKEAGLAVTLTVGSPQDDNSSTASTSQRSSQGSMVNAMAFPAVGENELRRNAPPAERLKEMARQRSFPNNPHSPDDEELYTVELPRGSRGFGFSIRGGREFNSMPLFVLRIAEGGSADLDGRLRVGDQILEINNCRTESMNHSEAIDIIQNGGPTVRLFVKRTGKLPPSFEPSNQMGGRYTNQGVPMANGPIGQSSPYLGRRNLDLRDEQMFYNNYQGGKQYQNY
ncbi:membrane-associated guanylate kinase, WW and PDZ domain-containing protein 1-like isoform X3 [Argopecten irradians]|uniref:membrane-associated guanylate kinase, WW and PDZ domain-containing protein 1-like isoform X3 n=1 Tax=Argopecten irradians TaxID=31199 RepID=UPI00371FEC44